uniref:EGF-like domain-containing protein n=1 Tax=Macrostomum lignano TaxID=282301 RepID=A0A1I8HDJ3_9PLAT
MMKLTASLLLVHIVLLCPTTPTPVTMMKRSRAEAEPKLEGDSLNERMQRELQANKQRVLKILEGREWYRAFLELLRNELKKKADHRIEVAKIYMRTADPARVRRSVEQDFEEALSRAARSVPAREDSRVEVSAALKVDGKVCLNVTKKAEAIRLGDSNEIIKADIGNTEILLSMKVTKKGAAAAVATAHAAIAAAKSANASRSGGLEQPWHGDYSQLQSHCTDRNYCLFGGTCVYYGIIELPLCNCRKGYKGNRCELYDINEVLSTLDSAHKRRVIGNGPIEQQGDHMDVLSVVESTAIYLLHVPKSYPSPQAMQWIQSILLSR